MHLDSLVVEVRDKELNRLGQIPLADLDILLEDQFNNVGSWTIHLRADHEMAPALRTPGAGIIVSDRDGQVLMSGPVVLARVEATVQDPGGTLIVEGLTDTVVLADRVAHVDPVGLDPTAASHDVRTGPVETLMHEYVYYNIGPGAHPDRRIPHLQMGTNGARGAVLTKRARFPVLGNLLSELALTANLGFRVVQVGSHLEFQTYEVRDRTSDVRFDIRNNTLSGHSVSIAPPSVTRAIVAGQGEMTNRQFVEVTSPEALAAEALWGRRIEQFIDQRQTDDLDELTRAGEEAIAEGGFAQLGVKVVPMEDIGIAQYGHEWQIGDTVTTIVEGTEMPVLVTGYVLKRNKDGFKFGAILGDPNATSESAEVSARVTKLEGRVSNLERNTETLANAGERIASLEGVVDDLGDQVGGLDSRISTTEANVGDLESRVDNLEQDVANLPSQIGPMTGEIRMWAGDTAPAGWHLCDGSAISRTTYAALFAVIGTRYGAGDGSTTFNVPNLCGRVPVGYDSSQTEFDALGKTGGAKTHTLTVDEMPSHTHIQDPHNHTQNPHSHTGSTASAGSHTHNVRYRAGGTVGGQDVNDAAARMYGGSLDTSSFSTLSGGAHTHSVTINSATATNNSATATNQNTGGGQPHNNLQPYVVINYIIKL